MHHIIELFAQIGIGVMCSILEEWAFRACLIFLCELTLGVTSAKSACLLPASSIFATVRMADAIFLVAFHELMTFLQVGVFKPDTEVLLDRNFLDKCGYFIEGFLQAHPALFKFIFGFLAVCYVVKSYN